MKGRLFGWTGVGILLLAMVLSGTVGVRPASAAGTVTLRSTSTYAVAGGHTSFPVPKPSGLVTGDVMVAALSVVYVRKMVRMGEATQ